METPDNFDWKHYATLNPYGNIPFDPKGAIQHYNRIGKRNNWTCNYGDLDVLVYSSGKTGSTTLGTSFSHSGYKTALLHADSIYPETDRIIDIINYPRNKKLQVITSYREPVSQFISIFFQNIPQITGLSDRDFMKKSIPWCKDKVIEYLKIICLKELPTNLFKESLRINYDGINVFDHPFDKEKGFVSIEGELIDLLIIRFDMINRWEDIIREQTPFTNFKMKPTNLTKHKAIGDLYRTITNSIVVPKEILDYLFEKEDVNLKYIFTDEEIASIKNKWYGRLEKSTQ